MDRQKDGHMDRQTERQTDRQTEVKREKEREELHVGWRESRKMVDLLKGLSHF